MPLAQFQLAEPIIAAMVNLLSSDLPSVITTLNATITDGYTVDEPVQYVPYVPVPSTLEGGMPIVGVREISAQILDDLEYSADAVHRYAVVAIVQNVDQQALTWQLRRTAQAIAYTVQQDRLQQPGIMRSQAGAWSVNFEGTEPGPLFGEPVLDSGGRIVGPPQSYMSYTAVIFNSRRTEV